MSPCAAPLCLYRFLLCFLLPSSDELEDRLLEKVETTFYDTSSKKPAATVQPFMSSLIASLAAAGTSLPLHHDGPPCSSLLRAPSSWTILLRWGLGLGGSLLFLPQRLPLQGDCRWAKVSTCPSNPEKRRH